MKRIYISFLLHGNMCYDRYTKQEIRDKFPVIYAAGIRAMHRFPQVTAHIDFPGLTTLSLKRYAPWLISELKPLVERKQVILVGCQYAASHALCADEESDLLAAHLGMQIMRDELQADTHVFFPQEMAFHPQSPLIMRQIGATSLIVSPGEWQRPRRVRGVEGSEVNVYPVLPGGGSPDLLEALWDALDDGDFVLVGGDFEMLGSVAAYVERIAALAIQGKIIEWTTVDRYEEEVGTWQQFIAASPFGHSSDDRPESPSFSRWVSDPADIAWHGQALAALDALRTAGMAKAAAQIHGLEPGTVDARLAAAWTTEPDNVWDHYFEHVLEYPEVEERYLTPDGQPTILSRAWHQALIGLNSDASGWVPWTPRTRHRVVALQSAQALAQEVIARFARQVAQRTARLRRADGGCVLALNAAPARTAELAVATDRPMALTEPDGTPIPTATLLQEGHWVARARVALPAYGYKLLGLVPTDSVERWQWQQGHTVEFAGRRAALENGLLTICEGEQVITVSLAPFALADPAGLAPEEVVRPCWDGARTRIRRTSLGQDLEILVELAWTIWLRLVIGLRNDRVDLTADLFFDMPRTIGRRRFDPEGVVLQLTGRPGTVYYDIPFATIRHAGVEPAFVAVQRFAALLANDPDGPSFGLIALSGNQSYKVAGGAGTISVGLGASKQARPAIRPACVVAADGTAQHTVVAAPDPLYGASQHRFAVVFGCPAQVALAAYKLRTGIPVVHVEPGHGNWPGEQSLFTILPDTVRVIAFRTGQKGVEIAVNDLSGRPTVVSCQGHSVEMGAYGLVTVLL